MKTLGGSTFIRSGNLYDYCYRESIKCLQELCDKVSVVVIETDDGTAEEVKSLADDKTKIICLPDSVWQATRHLKKEQLSYFSNIAHSALDTDYFFYLQGDECLHENSYDVIRTAIETPNPGGFLCRRHNLWKDCNHVLNVPIERRPCSAHVIRLAKRGTVSWDDAEQLYTQASEQFINEIILVHYGFVRKKEVHAAKIRNMMTQIFQQGEPQEIVGMEVFDSTKWFNDEDLLPFSIEQHPKIMREWIATRP
ncbi:MAG: hypothetical protein ACHQNT_13415 [Bacteroidia bacterium]